RAFSSTRRSSTIRRTLPGTRATRRAMPGWRSPRESTCCSSRPLTTSIQRALPRGWTSTARRAGWEGIGGRGTSAAGRPSARRGVTGCVKLLHLVDPDIAFFGQKDAQQVAVIEQLVRDFNLPIEIVTVPTVRDVDGLALSSRNVRLSPDERRRALEIPRALAAG